MTNKNDDSTGLENFDSFMNEAAEKMSPPPPSYRPPTQQPAVSATTRPGNEVFSSQNTAPLSNSAVSRQQEYARKEFGIEIPVDAVPLPSVGKLYSPDHPYHLAEHVEYKAMTAKEEDILMNAAYIKKGTVINELIKSCLLDRNVDVNSLVSGDRNALMIAIRISGYGQDYQTSFVCPRCDHKNDMHVDLANLDLKPLDLEPLAVGENRFSFTLPNSKKKVLFKFLTGKEEEDAVRQAESRKKKGLLNTQTVTSRLMYSIVSVEGNEDQGYIAKFVEVMRAADSLALRKYIDQHEPGVNMEVEFTCNNCDYFDKIQLPLGSNFFWPGSQR
jgi:hypothetical protein